MNSKNVLNVVKIKSEKQMFFSSDILLKEIFYILYGYFIEGQVALKFSSFVRKSIFIQNITETNHKNS